MSSPGQNDEHFLRSYDINRVFRQKRRFMDIMTEAIFDTVTNAISQSELQTKTCKGC